MGVLEGVGGSGEVGAEGMGLVKAVSGLSQLAAGARGWGYWVSTECWWGEATFPSDGPGRTRQVPDQEILPRPGPASWGSC